MLLIGLYLVLSREHYGTEKEKEDIFESSTNILNFKPMELEIENIISTVSSPIAKQAQEPWLKKKQNS